MHVESNVSNESSQEDVESEERWYELAFKLELLDAVIALTASDVRNDKELFPKVKAKLDELFDILDEESIKHDNEKMERAIALTMEIISMINEKYPVTVVLVDD